MKRYWVSIAVKVPRILEFCGIEASDEREAYQKALKLADEGDGEFIDDMVAWPDYDLDEDKVDQHGVPLGVHVEEEK